MLENFNPISPTLNKHRMMLGSFNPYLSTLNKHRMVLERFNPNPPTVNEHPMMLGRFNPNPPTLNFDNSKPLPICPEFPCKPTSPCNQYGSSPAASTSASYTSDVGLEVLPEVHPARTYHIGSIRYKCRARSRPLHTTSTSHEVHALTISLVGTYIFSILSPTHGFPTSDQDKRM